MQDGIVKEIYVSGVNSGVGILSQVSHFDSKTFAVTLAQSGSLDEQISELKKMEG
ncbi:MAG: hypothetical protein JNK41_03125 [Saprospiraceae bacterium]|nr:hypothetical protein [Saprospiraceae bacterium]